MESERKDEERRKDKEGRTREEIVETRQTPGLISSQLVNMWLISRQLVEVLTIGCQLFVDWSANRISLSGTQKL